MKFITEDFLLQTATARRIYHKFAEPQPIFDYHCHLSPGEIAENRRFQNLFEIWLDGDHYKWRAMRANGVPERFCTGNAEPWDKFRAWVATVPHTLRNPLYHWTHLELKRYFGINELLNEKSAPRIWQRANEQLAGGELTTQGILKKFKVKALCTTDDPTDDLRHHKHIAAKPFGTRVTPAYRPDKALTVNDTTQFLPWLARLEEASDRDIGSLSAFLDALRLRHDFFHAQGCRLSDHGMNHCFADFCTEKIAATIFAKARKGRAVLPEEHAKFAAFMMLFFGRLDAEKGWTKQLHLGALRNVNSRQMKKLGPDTGYDGIGDFPQISALSAYLNRLEMDDSLPKTIIYNLNPADNYAFAGVIGNFQDGITPGKIQYGSGWWFMDQKEGMEWQINALSNIGSLSRFVGMVTDSRSFMSYTRHEYFRRVLCNLIGRDVENGELPADDALLGPLISNICYRNAEQYIALPVLKLASK